MTSPPQIAGIMLVRNEDLWIERTLRNALDFCDVLHVCDHQSTDATPEILARLAAEFPKLRVASIQNPRESNTPLLDYVGKPTWVFGVDGDEIYDPAGLRRFRTRLLAGEFDSWWALFGNVLNCDEIDARRRTAAGYLAPPCRSMTKLYNFRMLRELDPTAPQRLHSHPGRDVFLEGFHAGLRCDLHEQTVWDDADFRCLHACFVPRSSREEAGCPRENVTEGLRPMRRLARFARRALGGRTSSDYKRDKYRRGSRVSVDATPFFP
jgi:glycosyltransferase involved in cell wall biosynthesis